jgi:hypothetical protein
LDGIGDLSPSAADRVDEVQTATGFQALDVISGELGRVQCDFFLETGLW